MDCDHKLNRAKGCEHLTFCMRCGHWFAAVVDDDGFVGWRPFNREPVELGAVHAWSG